MLFRLRLMAPLLALLLLLPVMPLSASVLYSNGPVNGNVDAWTVDGNYHVTNSFQLLSPSVITGVIFGAWGYPGRTGVWADWAITSTAFGPALAGGRATLTNTFLFNNSQGADVWEESFTIPALSLGPGTYWLELDDTMTTNSRWFWWDQSDGPSQAQRTSQYGGGSMGSESFQILGTAVGAEAAPEPGSFGLLVSGTLLMGVALVRKRKPRP